MSRTPIPAHGALRVALLEPPRESSWTHINDIANAPLSSSLMTGYAAASLAARGHNVSVVDAHMGALSPAAAVAAVAAAKPDLVGVHLVYDWSDGAHVRRLLAEVSEAAGGVALVLYGFYPTFAHRELLRTLPEAGAAILGEPEETLADVAAAVAAGSRLPEGLGSIPGLALRRNGSAALTPGRPPIADLDALPFPHRTPEMLGLREVNVAGSRGCYGACTFCTINPFYGPRSGWRPRRPESVVDEMAAALEAHPEKKRFYFVDPNFFGPGERGRSRALALGRLIRERFSVKFGLEGRVNDIDEEVVGALVEAGFDEILIGLESGSNATLARLNKKTTVDQNRRALRILRAHGVEPNVGFIMFEPESTLEDVRVNLAFLEEVELLSRLSVTANVLYHQQILLAPTPAYRSALAEGRLVVSPVNAYEGTLPYRHPEVAFLAETMAEGCRHVFAGLPVEVWLCGDQAADPVLKRLNDRLVSLFRRLLDALAAKTLLPSPGAAREVVDEVKGYLAAAHPT
ncbi:MAG: radical SAM protein [Deltaproteobacteria bacterium]|nr:radical SAM protein [Deltaproteobacteria bacterium]